MTTSDQLVVVSDFSAGAYLFLYNACEEVPRSKIEIPFVARGCGARRYQKDLARRVLAAIGRTWVSTPDLAATCVVDRGAVQQVVRRLWAEGIVERHGTDRPLYRRAR